MFQKKLFISHIPKNNCSVDNLFLSVDTLEKKRRSISSFSIDSSSHVNIYVKSSSAEKNTLKTKTLWRDVKIEQVHIDSFDTAKIILSSEIKDIVLRSKKYVTRRTTKQVKKNNKFTKQEKPYAI